MASKNQKQEQEKLFKRYLIWCYKTTKEDFDRIERKLTQLEVDRFLEKRLLADLAGKAVSAGYKAKVDEFTSYIAEKAKSAAGTKYVDENEKELEPEYWYLKARLEAVKQAIKHFVGAKAVKEIADLYEQEMISRILAAREH